MSIKAFIDTNIFVYAQVINENQKHVIARDLLKSKLFNNNVYISTQVLGEFYSAMFKYKRSHAETSKMINELIIGANVAAVMISTVQLGLKIAGKYGHSYWDSLLLAAAIENDCELFYSEDMQHNQVIEGSLTIKNPFM